jgi:hypothetical protein
MHKSKGEVNWSGERGLYFRQTLRRMLERVRGMDQLRHFEGGQPRICVGVEHSFEWELRQSWMSRLGGDHLW